MRDDPVHIPARQTNLVQRRVGSFGKLFNGMTEDFLPLHAQVTSRSGRNATIH